MKKRILGLLLTLGVMFTLSLPVLASESSATVFRLAGADRYATAVSIAKTGWEQSDYVVLAYGGNFPDALSAGVLAKKYDAPILLTSGNALPGATKNALKELKTRNVFLIGGSGVIPATIETELSGMGINVTRFAGQDRYETATKIAQQLSKPTELIVTTGEDYADALSIAPIAASKEIPILLVSKDAVADSVKSYLSTLNVTKTYVLGDSSIVADSVFNQFPNAERIVGADKYERNAAINQRLAGDMGSSSICIATGEGFADALTGSVLAAKKATPIILVNNSLSDAALKSKLQQDYPQAQKLYLFGGTGVFSYDLFMSLVDKTHSSNTNTSSSTSATPPDSDIAGLYTENGTGEFSGRQRLMGYPEASRFAIYFTASTEGSMTRTATTVVDLRGLNNNELVRWTYNGTPMTNTRKECNSFFSDVSYLSSKLQGTVISSEWLYATFGQVYLDWAEFLQFSNDASHLVNKYLAAKEPTNSNSIVTIKPDTVIKWRGASFQKMILNADQVQRYGVLAHPDPERPGYYFVYSLETSSGLSSVYYMDEMTEEFMQAENAIGVFNGIRTLKSKGDIFFHEDDLNANGIL
ncbi:MAG TPA: cell wall-binding repeat-containing protein [Desulfitobacterium dehalogenans]|uniref:Cell wall-binding repeat-containing protein n=1 Tax=Desulfitobacterium dehalogenans TaxID=36854 RepID=A0A7C6Z2Y2_9FIRM|nr:cell wall-binding repeat-containing protein [Desulfitobacterium dehalogenans]